MGAILALCFVALLVFPKTGEAHRYDRWGSATLNDFNYAVASVCGSGFWWICERRKTGSDIAVQAATDHTWVTRTRYDSGGTSNWTHIEQHQFGARVRCYTVAYSYHGQLVGVDRSGSPPYDFCDPI
jgi:hypothetical protein